MAITDFFDSASSLRFIVGYCGSLLEAAVWSKTTWAGRTKGRKMAACCCFANLAGGSSWLFLARMAIDNVSSRLGGLDGVGHSKLHTGSLGGC